MSEDALLLRVSLGSTGERHLEIAPTPLSAERSDGTVEIAAAPAMDANSPGSLQSIRHDR